METNDYAVVVGIAHYPEISDLKGPENDAKDFYAWLTDENGGALLKEQATLILSSDHPGALQRRDARPIAQDINDAFERIIDKGLQSGKEVGRRLYIFMAGHGFSPTQVESALLMANANASLYLHHIPGRCYAQWIIREALFDEVVLLMDCCRDDYPFVPVACPSWGSNRTSGTYNKTRWFFGFATSWTYKSRERALPPDGTYRGLFSKSLLEGLQGLACDQQGYVTSGKLKGYVQNRLPAFFKSQNGYQSPVFEGDENIIFTQGHCRCTHVQISFGQLAGDSLVKLIGPTRQPVGEHLPKDGAWEIDLVPGEYQLFVPDAARLEPITIIGEVQDVSL